MTKNVSISILHPALPTEIIELSTSKKRVTRPRRNSALEAPSPQKKPSIPTNPSKLILDPVKPHPKVLNFAVSIYLETKIRKDICSPGSSYSVFDEFKNPIDCQKILQIDQYAIYYYLNKVQKIAHLDPTSIVLSVFFFEKLIENQPKLPVTTRTWKRLITGCLILGCKVYEELSVLLTDFISTRNLPFLNISSLKKLEVAVLDLLDFSIGWTPSDYTKTLLKFDLSDCELN